MQATNNLEMEQVFSLRHLLTAAAEQTDSHVAVDGESFGASRAVLTQVRFVHTSDSSLPPPPHTERWATSAAEDSACATPMWLLIIQKAPFLSQTNTCLQCVLLAVALAVGQWLDKRKVAWLGEAGVALLLGILMGMLSRAFTFSSTYVSWMSFQVSSMTSLTML